MALVTIGVPVYNAALLLEECLENIRAQTFQDFTVLIYDNASTDETPAIAAQFVQRDPRFRLVSQSQNKGALANFEDVLLAATSPLFLWRAYDDLASPEFLERLVRALGARPEAQLAVGTVETRELGGKVRSLGRAPIKQRTDTNLTYALKLLWGAQASWIYGLYRTEALKASFAEVRARFPHLVAFDFLTFLPFLLSGDIAADNSALFIQRVRDKDTGQRKRLLRDPAAMATLRRDFLNLSLHMLNQSGHGFPARQTLRPALWFYAERAYRWRKILRARMRVIMGEKPQLDASQSS